MGVTQRPSDEAGPVGTAPHELPPGVRVRGGIHYAVCPACGEESRIGVRHKENPDPRAIFVTRADETGQPLEWERGQVAEYDFSAHEEHVKEHHA